MSVVAMPDTAAPRPFAASLLPIMGAVFVAFLVIGVAMPVLPLYVHDGLGFGTFVVGLVAGSQFAASLISRPWAGHYSDGRGAKRAVFAGLLAASASGLLYFVRSCSAARSGGIGRRVAARAGRAWRSGELHHHCRGQLGTGGRRSPEHREGHRLGRVRDVRGLRDRSAGRLRALRRLRFRRDRGRHGAGSSRHIAAHRTASGRRARAARPLIVRRSVRIGVGTGSRLGVRQRRLRRRDHVRRAAVRRSRLDARAGSHTPPTPSRSYWRACSSATRRTSSAAPGSR